MARPTAPCAARRATSPAPLAGVPHTSSQCYYITPIKREVSKPFTVGMPPRDICFRKLRSKNTELCEMRFRTCRGTGSSHRRHQWLRARPRLQSAGPRAGRRARRRCDRTLNSARRRCTRAPPFLPAPATTIERGNTDYNSLTIKELKNILAERGTACKGCLEKADFVRRCKETERTEL